MNQQFLERVIARYSEGVGDRHYTDEWWSHTLDKATKLVSLLEARPPAKVLDLACGTGGVTTALASRGFCMTGIDCTPAMLDEGRKVSKRKDVAVEWLLQDVREIEYEERFDYVLMWDVWFGLFDDEGEDRELICRASSALRAGGRCLFEVYNKEFAQIHGVENSYSYDENLDRFVEKGSGQCSVKLYSHAEWESMLAASHLRIVRTDGWNWNGDPDPPPWRADYYVAEKESG